MRKTQTIEDVQETFGRIKRDESRIAMARAMLSHGNLTEEARAYVAREYPQEVSRA